MTLHSERTTDRWFNRLSRSLGNTVMIERMPEYIHKRLRGEYPSPKKWWNTRNWVQKSVAYDKHITLKKKTTNPKTKLRGEKHDY